VLGSAFTRDSCWLAHRIVLLRAFATNGYCIGNLAFIVWHCLGPVQLSFYLQQDRWVTLDHINKFAHFLVLVLQVVPQGFVVLKQLFVLLVQRLQLAGSLREV